MSSIPLGSTAPDNRKPIGWAKKRAIEPIKSERQWRSGAFRLDEMHTTVSSNPFGSTAPDNRKPIGWAKKICKPE